MHCHGNISLISLVNDWNISAELCYQVIRQLNQILNQCYFMPWLLAISFILLDEDDTSDATGSELPRRLSTIGLVADSQDTPMALPVNEIVLFS